MTIVVNGQVVFSSFSDCLVILYQLPTSLQLKIVFCAMRKVSLNIVYILTYSFVGWENST